MFTGEECGLSGRQNFNPVVIGVVDEVQTHGFVLEAYPTILFVILVDSIVITADTEAQMTFVFTQFVGLGMVFQTGEL